MHILGAIAEFERARIAERVQAGLQRARAQGKRLGRPRKVRLATASTGGSVREAARTWGVSKSTAARWINAGQSPTAPLAQAPRQGEGGSGLSALRRCREALS
jgi:DNA invertase Pin-like site-specific DNA recombinase